MSELVFSSVSLAGEHTHLGSMGVSGPVALELRQTDAIIHEAITLVNSGRQLLKIDIDSSGFTITYHAYMGKKEVTVRFEDGKVVRVTEVE